MAITPPSSMSPALPDAPPGNWVDRYLPEALKPYAHLARFDRPIGSWLLLFPCWWSQTLAELDLGRVTPNLWFLLLFLIGAFVMRGAGCTYNDIVDRDFDGRVERTARRPIPSGAVSVKKAFAWACVLSLIGLAVLVQFNRFTIALGMSSLLLIAIYPFMKRYTYWPQLVLGLTFKWGALVGWAAIQGALAPAALILYVGSILWTIGYDTIYAHQDKDDDAVLGLRSTALRFGEATERWVSGFYAGALVLWAIAGYLSHAQHVFFLALAAIAGHFVWQIVTLDTANAANCLHRFRSNRNVGWIFFAGVVAEILIAGRG